MTKGRKRISSNIVLCVFEIYEQNEAKCKQMGISRRITAREIRELIKKEFDTEVGETTINAYLRKRKGKESEVPQKKVCNDKTTAASNDALIFDAIANNAEPPLSAEEIAKAVKLYRELKKLGIQIQ